MANDTDTDLEVIDLEDEETEDEETEAKAKVIRPSDLAEELDIDPKSLRGFLRSEFPRPAAEKNTSWHLTAEMIEAARDHFLELEEDDDETEEDENGDE